MFTGLIEDVGTLLELRRGADAASITVATALPRGLATVSLSTASA